MNFLRFALIMLSILALCLLSVNSLPTVSTDADTAERALTGRDGKVTLKCSINIYRNLPTSVFDILKSMLTFKSGHKILQGIYLVSTLNVKAFGLAY